MDLDDTRFSAAESAAGYLYQARLALAVCLRYVYAESAVEIGVERLDDVSFESKGAPLELLQTKHHINRVGSLSDYSSDLWKTLRIWSEAVAKDPSLPSRTKFVLVTTSIAQDGQATTLLRPTETYRDGKKRDPKHANILLNNVARTARNKSLQSSYDAFLSLTPKMQISLLSAIEVLDNHVLLDDLSKVIEDAIRIIAPRGKVGTAREMLEGWWWPRVCSALMQSPSGSIAILEVEAKLDDIRDQLKRDTLVADLEHADPPETEISDYEGRVFIKQLKAIGIGGNRIQYAMRDYYRAYTQRSKWVREHLVFDGEIARFEAILVEEWQPRFEQMCEANADKSTEAAVLRQAGQELYQWVENEARFPFRSLMARFLNVGSYHMLSNELRVGWHRDFAAICSDES